MIPHDSNFKNFFYDFSKETLQWLLPQAEQNWGGYILIEADFKYHYIEV